MRILWMLILYCEQQLGGKVFNEKARGFFSSSEIASSFYHLWSSVMSDKSDVVLTIVVIK